MQGLDVPYSYLAAAAANQDSKVAKAVPTRLRGFVLNNVSAAVKYVKVYDKATAPTSADTPVLRFGLNANSSLAREFNPGIPFAAGLSFRITGAQADNDATAVTAGDVVVNLEFE